MSKSNNVSNRVYVVDVTLRDGLQSRGVSASLQDKQKIAEKLDNIGVDIIEAGWPGANPMDTEFFKSNFPYVKNSEVTSFGMTRGVGKNANTLDPNLDHNAAWVTFVGKSSELHVMKAIETTLEENLNMIRDSVKYAVSKGKRVIFDAEHFFDGYKANTEYTTECLRAAHEAGAQWLVLCDTNGGAMPWEVSKIVGEVKTKLPGANIGIHCHNDVGMAVANTLYAVEAGARMVQVTIGGLGERCGNADLFQVIPSLVLKMGYDVGKLNNHLSELKELYGEVYEILFLKTDDNKPYVGDNAFAHKGGLHASAFMKDPDLYQHMRPEVIGNASLVVGSNMSGTANMVSLLSNMGFEVKDGDECPKKLLEKVKEFEHKGYSFDRAEESLKLLALEIKGKLPNYFSVEDYTVNIKNGGGSRAWVKVKVGDKFYEGSADGNGPVHALDSALRPVLVKTYPDLDRIHLNDYKVEIVNGRDATAATTRVFISSIYKDSAKTDKYVCSTIGVKENIVEASLNALIDAFKYMLVENKVAVNF